MNVRDLDGELVKEYRIINNDYDGAGDHIYFVTKNYDELLSKYYIARAVNRRVRIEVRLVTKWEGMTIHD